MIAALASIVAAAAWTGHDEEWRVRRWALDPARYGLELRAALAEEGWRARASALDALARTGSTRPEFAETAESLALDFVEDPHPSVRALALSAIAEVGRGEIVVADAVASRLARDDLPAVRSALARCAGRGLADPELLATLAFDEDERVRREARVGVFAGAGAASQDGVLARIANEGSTEELVSALESCRRRLHLERGPVPSAPDVSDGDLDVALRTLLAGIRPDEAAAADLFSGWYSPPIVDRDVKRFLLEVGRLAHPDVGSAALDLFAEVDAGASERFPAQVGRALRLGQRERIEGDTLLLAIARELLGPEVALAQLATRSLSELAVGLVLEEVGFLVEIWTPELGRRFLEGRRSETRATALAAIARAWAGAGDAGAGELLVEVLRQGDGEEQARAFVALCQADDPRPYVGDLFDYWRELADADRIEALRELARGRPLEPFRVDLLELGERGGTARSRVIDLLELFERDEAVASAFTRWLDEELALVRDAAEDELRRAAELRATSLLRGLVRVRGDDALGSVRSVLAGSAGPSEPIGVVAATLLGARSAQRDFLAGFLDPSVGLRTRIEVAIALAPTGDERALQLLLSEAASREWDLGARMVDAVGGSPSDRALTWLAERALDASASANLRRKAITAIAGRPLDERALDAWTRAAADAPDVDSQLAAIRELAAAGRAADAAAARLRDLWAALEIGRDGTRLAESLGDEREAIRAELLLALARLDHLPAELLPDVMAGPMGAADEWFRRRSAGEPVARADVSWRVEVETAGALFDHGRGLELLEASGAWWSLDGRLLLCLAERAARSPDASARQLARILERAAGIAIAPQGNADVEGRLQQMLLAADLALRAEDWRAVAAGTAALARAWREQSVSDLAWRRYVGRVQRRLGEDPPSLLKVSELHARARAALVIGDRERSRRLASAAAERAGYSARAATLLAEFEALLGE